MMGAVWQVRLHGPVGLLLPLLAALVALMVIGAVTVGRWII